MKPTPASIASAVQGNRVGFLFVEADEVEKMINARLAPLEQELALIKSLQCEYVSTQEALKILGFKDADTLRAMREREGSVIVAKFEGKNEQIPKYLRSSLLAHNAERQAHPRRAGRNLAA